MDEEEFVSASAGSGNFPRPLRFRKPANGRCTPIGSWARGWRPHQPLTPRPAPLPAATLALVCAALVIEQWPRSWRYYNQLAQTYCGRRTGRRTPQRPAHARPPDTHDTRRRISATPNHNCPIAAPIPPRLIQFARRIQFGK